MRETLQIFDLRLELTHHIFFNIHWIYDLQEKQLEFIRGHENL